MQLEFETISFIKEKVLWLLDNAKLNKRSQHLLLSILAMIDYPYLKKLQSCSLTLSDEENHLHIEYSSRKIEISDTHSVDLGSGYDHYQTFCLQYFPEVDLLRKEPYDIYDQTENLFQNIIRQKDYKLIIYKEK